jgi:glycosyltransferase involved in cell wall biosynthesis
MSGKLRGQPNTGARERKSARAESIIALEQAHREELERIHLQYAERIRQVEAARLENESKLEQQQDFYANLAEQYRGETKQRATELLAAKDLLLQATTGAATIENRLVQMESLRDALETERRSLHEALQTLRTEHADQGKAATQLQAQRDALETERRSLHEALQSLQEQLAAQGKAATQLQAQRDALATERRTLQETLQTLRAQYMQQGKAAAHISQSYSDITRHTVKPAADAASVKMEPVIEFKAPQQAEGVVQPAGLDVVPLPVGRNSMTAEEKALFDEKLDGAMKTGGVQALEKLVEKQAVGRSPKFASFCQQRAAHAALANGHVSDATRMADIALKNGPEAATVRGAAHVYYDAALLERANQLVDRLESMQETVSVGDRRFIDEARGQAQLADWATEPAAPRSLPVIKGRVLNVLAFSLPYSSVGYATRSHGLAIGIKHAGWDIRPYTRPCFPYDSKPELEGQTLPEQDDIDGITYRRLFDFERRGMNEVEYLHAAIACLTRVIEKEQPEIVHAASNYATALPALIAARRLGVPFVYEMRGFWEVTRSSRDEAFENTPKYRFMQLFDRLVARHADHVITITTAMKEELLARGVPAGKISIAFNSVDPARFVPRAPNKALAERLRIPDGAPVIGYVGSFVDYEGLDDLITATAGLKQTGHDFRLLLVGDGAAFESLREQVHRLGLEDKTVLTGRVPHEEVEDYYSLIDIAPFPRKPWKVCELVSPLKPFEAMALEKAVVVSSTRALMEIVDHERNGLVFEKGNVDSLRNVLDVLIRQPEKRLKMGKAARKWISAERSWDRSGIIASNVYKQILTAYT